MDVEVVMPDGGRLEEEEEEEEKEEDAVEDRDLFGGTLTDHSIIPGGPCCCLVGTKSAASDLFVPVPAVAVTR